MGHELIGSVAERWKYRGVWRADSLARFGGDIYHMPSLRTSAQ